MDAVLQEVQAVEKSELILNQISFNRLEVSNKVAVLGLLGRLHIGEVEVIIGAIENEIQTVLLDDNAARNKAKQLGLNVTGTLGILLRASKNGLVTDLEQEVNNLKSTGMYLSPEIIGKILT